jgi:hypothetical protein
VAPRRLRLLTAGALAVTAALLAAPAARAQAPLPPASRVWLGLQLSPRDGGVTVDRVEYCAFLPGGGTGTLPCGVTLAPGASAVVACDSGTVAGTVTASVPLAGDLTRTVEVPFRATIANGTGTVEGPAGRAVRNATDSALPVPAPNAYAYGTATLRPTLVVVSGPAACAAGNDGPPWSFRADVTVDPDTAEDATSDAYLLSGSLPVEVVDALDAQDTDLAAAEVSGVGIDPDTGLFLQPIGNDPNGGSGRTCKRAARVDRSIGPPAIAAPVQVIYFVPNDVPPNMGLDQPIVCNDGYRVESGIGYAFMNLRDWTASVRGGQADRIHGKSYKRQIRSVTAYDKSFTFTNVMFVRGNQTEAYYRDYEYGAFDAIVTEMVHRGWRGGRFAVFADVTGLHAVGGTADVGGEWAVAYRRLRSNKGVQTAVRWGCATDGDTAAAHELTHEFGAVPPGAPEWVTGYHVTQEPDLMYPTLRSTFSARRTNGTATAPTSWDRDKDSYTSTILTAANGYLDANQNGILRVC